MVNKIGERKKKKKIAVYKQWDIEYLKVEIGVQIEP